MASSAAAPDESPAQNGEALSIHRKKFLITRNLQETLGEDRLLNILKERDIRVN